MNIEIQIKHYLCIFRESNLKKITVFKKLILSCGLFKIKIFRLIAYISTNPTIISVFRYYISVLYVVLFRIDEKEQKIFVN